MNAKKEGRLEILKAIRDGKNILMGVFSDKLTKDDKIRAWKDVHSKALALGLVPENKDYSYTRGTFWQNIRKNTMKKIDNKRQTGSGGGPECKLNEIDNLVCDIVGKNSPVMDGIPTKKTWDPEEVPKFARVQNDIEPSYAPAPPIQKKETLKISRSFHEHDETEEEMRIKKLRLSIDIMEREKLFKELQILQLERQLMVEPSHFTKKFSDVDQVLIENENM